MIDTIPSNVFRSYLNPTLRLDSCLSVLGEAGSGVLPQLNVLGTSADIHRFRTFAVKVSRAQPPRSISLNVSLCPSPFVCSNVHIHSVSI